MLLFVPCPFFPFSCSTGATGSRQNNWPHSSPRLIKLSYGSNKALYLLINPRSGPQSSRLVHQKMRSASWGDFPIIHSIIFFLSCCVSCVKETLKITTPCFMMLACVRSEGHIQRPFSCFLYSLSQSKPSLPSPSRGSKFSDGDPASKRPFRWPSREVATLRKKFEVFLLVNSQVLYAFLRGMMHHS